MPSPIFPTESKKITIVLDWTPNTNHTGIFVAQAKGYFEETGLDVEIVQPPEGGAEALVASGKAQFSISFQDSLAPAFIGDNAIPVTAVAAVIQHNTSGIISCKGEGMDTPKGLEGTQKKYPSQLSGGMRQRAALLRTYMFSNEVALLDEPFSALDTITKSSMHKWYLNIMDKIQLSTLFITHDIDEAILISDRIYLLSGSPGEITGEIIIKEPKPRCDNFNLTEEFLNYKRAILSLL